MVLIVKHLKEILKNQIIRTFKYPKIHKLMNNYYVYSVDDTIKSLIYSNKSLSRFGDGEIKWIFLQSDVPFEKNSTKLRLRLLEVLKSNNNRLEIGLPNIFCNDNIYNNKSKRFYELFMTTIGYKIFSYLNINKRYYNTGISRLYSEIKHKQKNSPRLFKLLKQIWNKKNLLIIEGVGTRLGVGNGLFNNASSIKRIECPITNAFESYNKIFTASRNYLRCHPNLLTLIALGPTATILSYDLTNLGYRSIDIGHIDMEYEWYLMGAKKKINIPTRYVNETLDNNGTIINPIHNKKYNNEIVCQIK